MSPNIPTTTRVRRLGIGLLVAVAAAGGLLAWTRLEHTEAENARRLAATALAAARDRLDSAAVADARAADLNRQFAVVAASGIVGELDRIDWLESLRTLHARLNFGELDLELGADHPLDSRSTWLHASTLHLAGPIAHEGQLLELLAQLHARRDALAVARHCHVQRNPQAAPDEPARQLLADCEVDLVTLQTARAPTPARP